MSATSPPAGGGHSHAGQPLRVLFVCTANISRSPYAELYARASTQRRGVPLEFDSAGTWAVPGNPIDPVMGYQLAQRGIDSGAFRSRRVTPQDVSDADVVLVMEEVHRSFLLEDVPAAIGKVFTLGQFAGRTVQFPTAHGTDLVDALGKRRTRGRVDDDVADPYRRGEEVAAATASRLDRLLEVALYALHPASGEQAPAPIPGRRG
ncbi:low molecular weight phosphatase family protein [Nocardioides mangrovicus]|uniref:Low molecular weight phosphatase family protein n=1 Tax=Nocardioides mangrovicus TaxID=2478913 RepID=A0A3L8NWN1_9ACTN|nr:low molecular weight phosphatase family protein [Nocardioides mangrovicus]RLV47656.1 low molecular weight phosphatase family protein [Nocardioides mangrovicus]